MRHPSWQQSSGKIKTSGYQTITESNANGLVEAGIYYFGEDGKMQVTTPKDDTTGIVNENGTLCYKKNGVVQKNSGLIKYEGAYYFVCYSGKIKTSGYQTITESNANGLVEAGIYYFGEDGKMQVTTPKDDTTGIVNENGTLCYKKNGVVQKNSGLRMEGKEI